MNKLKVGMKVRIKPTEGSPIVGDYVIVRISRITSGLTIRRVDGPYAGQTYNVAQYEVEVVS